MRAKAYSALADIAIKSSNYLRAAEHYWTGGRYVNDALKKAESRDRQSELTMWKGMLLHRYIQVLDRDPQPDDQRLNVWRACLDVFRLGAGQPRLLA